MTRRDFFYSVEVRGYTTESYLASRWMLDSSSNKIEKKKVKIKLDHNKGAARDSATVTRHLLFPHYFSKEVEKKDYYYSMPLTIYCPLPKLYIFKTKLKVE